eukprot:TRINITY_DN400_c0_g2_i1.p1 TRINITY_DN400_c0_g2~~TRINITY_DN400_c0_g2_i1.p1  ORF type:complete len:528 (+),score=118.97 TRINITY_DN400_c0_g2_i1:59-1585(+)
MRALLTACLLGLAGLASGVPDFCGDDTRDQGAEQSGRISHLPARGYGAGKTCWVINCEAGQTLHIRFESFLIGRSVERNGLPANASLSVTDMSGGLLEPFVGTGPLSSGQETLTAVTRQYPTGAVLFLHSSYETLRWPGFAASWRCGADPEPLTLPSVPDYDVPRKCDASQAVHGGTEAWGFLKGLHCFIVEPCGPGYRTGLVINEWSLVGLYMSVSVTNSTERDATEVDRHIQSRVPRAWAASYSGDMAVVLQVQAFAVQDSSKGLRVEARCLPLEVSEPESHTQLYLPECDSQVYAAQSGDELQAMPQAGLGGVKCFIVQCDAGQWTAVSLPWYNRGSRSNDMQVLQPDSFDSPRILWDGVRKVNGSMSGLVVEGRFALVRMTPRTPNLANAEVQIVWQCVPPGTTASPDAGTLPPGTPESASPGSPGTATPAPGSASTPAPSPLREEEGGDSGLSDGAIAGIVVGSIVGVVLLVAAGVLLCRSLNQGGEKNRADGTEPAEMTGTV